MAFTKVLGPGIHTLANVTSHNINSSGVVTATKFVGPFDTLSGDYITGIAATFTGNVSIGGTLTYMDVTNVDAVGIITAQEGIHFGIGATAGKFLASTGITTIASLKVGNLTSGNVTYAGSGGELIDSSNLTFNGADLLIDAATNAYKGVKFDNSFNLTFGSSSGTSARLYLKGTSNGEDDAGDTFLGTGTGGEQWFQSNTFTAFKVNADGTTKEALRIKSDGKVGIGSDDPQKNLDIYAGQTHGYIRLHNLNNGGTGYDSELSILGSASNSEMRINMGVNSDPDREQIKSYQSHLIFTTNTDERLRINSSGNVGVNTDFTGSQTWRNGKILEIFGGGGNVTGELHLGANRGDGAQSVGSINFYDNTQDSTHRHIAIIEADKVGSTSNKRGGDLLFYTKNDNTAAPTEKLRIKSTGEAHISDRNSANSGEHFFQAGSYGIRMNDINSYNHWYIERNYGGFQATPQVTLKASGHTGFNMINPTKVIHGEDSSATETNVLALRNYKSSVNTKPTLVFEASTSAGQGANSSIQGLAGTDAGGVDASNESGMKFIVRYGGSGTEREAFSIKKDGNIYFPSGQGINFAANTDDGGTSSATVLEDYEEGSYSTSMVSSNCTLDDSSGTGYYIKVGNMVHVRGQFSLNSNDGAPAASGTDGITQALPFPRASNGTFTGTMLQANINWGGPTSLAHPHYFNPVVADYICHVASDGLRFYMNRIEYAYLRLTNAYVHVGYPGYTHIMWNVTYQTT